jgi:hypothetical protein
MATRFHDRHEWIDFLKVREVARRIVADPSMIDDARRFVETHMVPDPHQRTYALMWVELLRLPAEQIAAALIEDSARGRLLRETSPPFGKGFTSREVADLIAQADAPAL